MFEWLLSAKELRSDIILVKMPVQVAKHKHQPNRKVSVFKQVNHTPSRLTAASCPVNLIEAKEKFLQHGILPQFKLKVPQQNKDPCLKKKRNQVNFDYFKEAKTILDTVKQKFGNGCNYVSEIMAVGLTLSKEQRL